MALIALAMTGAQTVTGPAAPRTAAAPSQPDRATVLREVAIAHGMLRGLQYNDAITTAQYQATGTQYIRRSGLQARRALASCEADEI
jgi:hypothetical protein